MAKGNAFFPAALPNDGYFDLVTVDADIGRMKSLNIMMSVETGEHFSFDHVCNLHHPILSIQYTAQD